LRSRTSQGDDDDPVAAGVRERALEAWASVTRATVAAFEDERVILTGTRGAVEPPTGADADAGGQPGGPPTNGVADTTQLKALGEVLVKAAAELFFASGAFRSPNAERAPLDERKRRRFYREASAFIDVAVEIGLPPAAHHVVETLEQSVNFDPRGVLLRTARVLKAAEAWGYQHDPLAIRLFVRLTQSYLATHRELLTDTACRDALLSALDTFVEAGWPDARRLVYRLDDAFR
jgi:hypothetical protein